MDVFRKNYLKIIIFAAAIFFISSVPALAIPPDPNNAAFLYYQAFLLNEKPDEAMRELVSQVARGKVEPNEAVIKYVEKCRPAIEMASYADELTDCDWGLKYSKGFSLRLGYLAQVRYLNYAIIADARIAAKNGDFKLAIERCLTGRKMGLQVGQAPMIVCYLVGIAIERFADMCMENIISNHQIDAQTLQNLDNKLDELNSRHKTLDFVWNAEWEMLESFITPEKIRELAVFFDWEPLNKEEFARERILKADEQFCQKNKAYFKEFQTVVLSACKLPYQQANDELKKLQDKVAQDFKENPDATVAGIAACNFSPAYRIEVRHNTLYNRLKAAIKIYLVKTQTGKLPDVLPADLPKDMYSGKDFVYEKTTDGFNLHSKGEDLAEYYDKFEFKVKK